MITRFITEREDLDVALFILRSCIRFFVDEQSPNRAQTI
jgi:hypothetical protein